MIVKVACAVCGREFERDTTNGHGMRKYCSTECAHIVKREKTRLYMAARRLRGAPAGKRMHKTCATDYTQSVSVKPASMSDARWRCELRRREKPEYYAICGMEVR